jgi:hypothetical protein
LTRDTASQQPGHIIVFAWIAKRNTQIELIIARGASRHGVKNVTPPSRTADAVNEPVTARIGTGGTNRHPDIIRLFRVMAVIHRDDRILRWRRMVRRVHFVMRRGQAVFDGYRQESCGRQVLADSIRTRRIKFEISAMNNQNSRMSSATWW